MTFIASVVARDGIAVIADSLVSSIIRSINHKDWISFLDEKKKGVNPGEDFKLTEEEINKLFERKPSHTKNYEDKLFQYDDHTIITTAGTAAINGKKIVKIISEIKLKAQKVKKTYNALTLEEKIEQFKKLLMEEIKEHIEKQGIITSTTFIISHFDKKTEIPNITKMTIVPNDTRSLADETAVFIKNDDQDKNRAVVCDGQYGIADRILYGGMLDAISTLTNMLDKMKIELEGLGIKEGDDEKLPKQFFANFFNTQLQNIFEQRGKEAYVFQLSNLSLQQATDLAYLLLMVERDFQAYTKDIPTVGGVIKLATISKTGINFIMGRNIIKPTRHL